MPKKNRNSHGGKALIAAGGYLLLSARPIGTAGALPVFQQRRPAGRSGGWGHAVVTAANPYGMCREILVKRSPKYGDNLPNSGSAVFHG